MPVMATPQPSHTRRPGLSPAKDARVGVTSDVTCSGKGWSQLMMQKSPGSVEYLHWGL